MTKNPGAPVKAGDTLVLLNGHHGEFYLRGAYNEFTIIATGDTVEDHNHILKPTDILFEAPAAMDYHLHENATAVIDQGSIELAPHIDLEGTPHPSGGSVDIGSYEY